ncbi:tetratricopeptide repeat protein [Streptomyces sp. NPDC054837]
MEREQVVAVQGPDGPGSGYLIAPRLVLTSAHVVPPCGATVSVYRPGRPESWTTTVVWRGMPGGRDDAALLHLDDAAWDPPPLVPVRWGRLATHRPGTACESWGIPDLVQQAGRATDTLQPSGFLNPGDRHVGNRYVMNLDQHPPAPTRDGTSPWGGLSGAALFCGELLAGVIASDPAGRQHASLEAVPAYVLLHDADFRTALSDYGAHTSAVLEPVEWQHLAEAAESATGPARSPAALLRARRQIVPFRGRTTLLDTLDAWATEPGFAALLLHGPGGQGKTRLAQHLADTLAGQRWAVLWLRPDTTPESLAVLSAATVPLLLVVDYAETRTPQLTGLLAAAARHSGNTPFKLLMLARTAGDWWHTLPTVSPTAQDMLDGAPALHLPALEPEPGHSRTQAYQEAVHSYAAHLPHVRGWKDHNWPALAHHLTQLPAEHRPATGLQQHGLQTALTLHMTALADLLDAANQPAATDPSAALTAPAAEEGVEDRLLVHERRYWITSATTRGLHPVLSMATLTDALAAAFLLGADDQQQADALLHRVPDLDDQSRDRRRAVRDWIAALYPPTVHGSPWDTLQPDRLAERFLGRHLETDPHLAEHLTPGSTGQQSTQLLTVYTRAAAHTVFHHRLDEHLTALCVNNRSTLALPAIHVATQTEAPQPLLHALHQITDIPDTPLSRLEQLSGQLPRTSHNLAPWAAQLSQLITDKYRTLSQHTEQHLPNLAGILNNLAVWLGALGQWEEGLAAATEAADLYRELAQQHPDAFRPNLALSLSNLAVDLGDAGLREAALDTATEATDLYRELAQQHPDAFRPDFARSLTNLAVRLGALGRREEGLAAATEAADLYRELAQQHPDAHRPNLAMSLSILAIRLGALGRREEGLAAATEAADLYRELAQQHPDAFRPDFAKSLTNLTVRLGALGRREEGLAAATEAADLYRELAQQRPDAHRPDLAMSLNNLAVQLGKVGRREEGLAAATEATDHYRELAQQRPDAHRPDLAMSLNNLAADLANAGLREEGLAAATEAADLYRELAHQHPDAHRPNLALSLANLAKHLGELGRREEGLAAANEAVQIHQELAQQHPDVYRPDLEESLQVLAWLLQGDGSGASV